MSRPPISSTNAYHDVDVMWCSGKYVASHEDESREYVVFV